MSNKFFMASPLRTMGCHEIRCHTILLAAGHKQAHPALTPASKASIQFTYHRGMKGWVSWLHPNQELNPQQRDRKSGALTAVPSRYQFYFASLLTSKNYNNRKKLQFITLLTVHCFTHRKQQKMIKVILLRAPCQNVNVLLSNITFIIFAVFDVWNSADCR